MNAATPSQFAPDREADAGFMAEEAGNGFDFRKVIAVIRRNLIVTIAIVLAALVLGLIATLLITPRYVATASIQVDQEADRVLESTEVQPSAAYQDAERFLQTQADVLRSRSIAIRVAQQLRLFGNPQFFTAMRAAPPQPGANQQQTREAALRLLTSNLQVNLPRQSRVMTIAFESADATLAARIANAYASEFIKSNLQRKFDSSAYARNFLSQQLAEAKARLEDSERAVNDYSRQAGLIRTNDPTPNRDGGGLGAQSVTTASLVQLNEAANSARAARIDAEGKWRSVSAAGLLATSDVLGNSAVQQLLQQRAIASAAYRQERAKHLEEHPTVQQIQAQLSEINRQIDSIANAIRSSVREQYNGARLRENALFEQVEQMKGATLAEQDRSVRYNILAREADTNRTLYDGLLQRFKELSAAAGISSNNVSIIDEADAPLRPSSPRLLINLLVALIAGLGLAGLTILIREQLDDAIRVPEDLEQKLRLPILGVIPSVTTDPVNDLVNSLRAPVTEAYAALRTALTYSTQHGLPKTILVTSTQAAEGKSTTSFAIALSLARLGKRVLLIDVDLRRPSLHRMLGMANTAGLTDLLVQQANIGTVAQSTDVPGLSFIPSGPIPPNPTELLGSGRITALLNMMAESFDVVVLDGPPVLGLADAPLLATLADGTVFVVESNRGHRGATKTALRRLRTAHSTILGAVLTKFDARKAGSAYNYYGYDYYRYGSPQGADAKA